MTDAFGASPHDYPDDVELGRQDYPIDGAHEARPVPAPRPCLQCGGAEHYHCAACRSATCRHVLDLVRALIAR